MRQGLFGVLIVADGFKDLRRTADRLFSKLSPPNEESNCGSINENVGESVGAAFLLTPRIRLISKRYFDGSILALHHFPRMFQVKHCSDGCWGRGKPPPTAP
jgi:hypothetical protein